MRRSSWFINWSKWSQQSVTMIETLYASLQLIHNGTALGPSIDKGKQVKIDIYTSRITLWNPVSVISWLKWEVDKMAVEEIWLKWEVDKVAEEEENLMEVSAKKHGKTPPCPSEDQSDDEEICCRKIWMMMVGVPPSTSLLANCIFTHFLTFLLFARFTSTPAWSNFFSFPPSLVQLPFLSNHGQRPISARSPASVDFDNWTWSRWMTLKLNFSEANKCVSCGEHLQMCLMWRKFTNVSHVEKIYFEKSCYAMKRSSHVMFSRI